jgi:hypothetical protein
MAYGFTADTAELRAAAGKLEHEAADLAFLHSEWQPARAGDMGTADLAMAMKDFHDQFDLTVRVLSSDIREVSARLSQTASGYEDSDDAISRRYPDDWKPAH